MPASLLDFLFPPRESERVVRNACKDALACLMQPAVTSSGVTVLLSYDEPLVRAAVCETKFHGNGRAAQLLATALTDYLQEQLSEDCTYEERTHVLVPVPLSAARLRERGYNQVELVARLAGKALGIPVDTTLLIRTRATVPQTTLDGQARRNNLKGAFALTRAADRGVTYVLLDDVVTTGATLTEAGRILGESARVTAIALANAT